MGGFIEDYIGFRVLGFRAQSFEYLGECRGLGNSTEFGVSGAL